MVWGYRLYVALRLSSKIISRTPNSQTAQTTIPTSRPLRSPSRQKNPGTPTHTPFPAFIPTHPDPSFHLPPFLPLPSSLPTDPIPSLLQTPDATSKL